MVQLDPSSFLCTSCGKEFMSESFAVSHARFRCTGKQHVCTTCGKSFVDVRNLKKHELRHVPASNRPRCVHCEAKFLTARCLLRHFDGSYQQRRCSLCGARHRLCPKSGSLLGSHHSVNLTVTVSENPTPECLTEDKQTSSESSQVRPNCSSSATDRRIRSHISAVGVQLSSDSKQNAALSCNRLGIHKCPDCNKILTSRSNLLRHFRLHTGEKPYACVDCGKTFIDRGNMKKHCKVHKPSAPVDVDIPHHSITTGTPTADSAPNSSTNPASTHKTDRKSHLLTSVASELLRLKTELMPNSTCSQFDVQKLPRSSRRCRNTSNSYCCFVCNKTFLYKSILEAHMRTHMDQRPFQCEICGKAFKRTCDLLVHSRFHDEHKRFECHVCGKQFRWKNGLDRHQRVHTQERPFLCNHCGRSFADWGSHKLHMRQHSAPAHGFPTERYPCTLCGKSFAWKRGLVRHSQQVHIWSTASATE